MLRDRNVRLLLLSHLVSRTGGEAAFFVGIWGRAAFELGTSAVGIAIIMGAIGIAGMAGSAIAGVLVDRYDPRRVVVIGELLFVPGILAAGQAEQVWTLALFAALAWLPGSGVLTAMSAFPPFLDAGEDSIERGNIALEFAENMAFVTGPAIGAIIVRFLGDVTHVFTLDAVTSIIGVAIILRVALRGVERERDEGSTPLREALDGVRYVRSSPAVLLPMALGTLMFLSFGVFTTLEPLFFRDVLQTDVEALGWLNSLFGVGILAGTLVLNAFTKRFARLAVAVGLTTLAGTGALVYVGTDSITVVGVGAVYWGFLIGILFPLLRILLQRQARPAMVGRVMGLFEISQQAGEMIPLVVAPLLVLVFPVQPVLVGSGFVIVLVAPLFLRRARELDAEQPLDTQDLPVDVTVDIPPSGFR